MRKILLIGGNGFIGRHLSNMLVAKKYEVSILGRQNVPPGSLNEDVRYIVGDYRDETVLKDVITEHQVVIHLAHESINLSSKCDMALEFEKNIGPAETLIKVCLEKKIKKLVIVSSGGTVYGNPVRDEPLHEDCLTSPISLYGTSKLFIERVGLLNYYQSGLPVSIVRPANAYGPGQIPFKGQGIIATAFGCAYLGRDILMFGAGDAVRDYVHVSDVARAIVSVAEFGDAGEIYNVGTGVGVSIRDLISCHIAPVAAKYGFGVKISNEPARGVDVRYNVLDASKLRLIDSQEPISLSEGLEDSWAWITDQLRDFK